jgi:hypothetical protein
MENDIVFRINQTLSGSKLTETDWDKLEQELADYLNELILSDFNAVMTILYRIDVSEKKVRSLLAQTNGNSNAGELLAQLIIERQREKIKYRTNDSQ